jgi:hypothetical protein
VYINTHAGTVLAGSKKMKAEKIAKGKGRALKVALVKVGDLFKVYVLKSNYSCGLDRQAWFVVNSTMKGVTQAEAERVFASRAGA